MDSIWYWKMKDCFTIHNINFLYLYYEMHHSKHVNNTIVLLSYAFRKTMLSFQGLEKL